MSKASYKIHTHSPRACVKINVLYACPKERETVDGVMLRIRCCAQDKDVDIYIYQGETSRNALVRGREHLRGLEKRDEESVFVQHIRNHHDNDFSAAPCHQFKMCVTESHKTTLSRLGTEAVKINKETNPLLNRKSGFRVNTVLSLNTLGDVTVC